MKRLSIPFTENRRVISNSLVLCSQTDFSAEIIDCLSEEEFLKYASMRGESGKKLFALGRYSAKRAVESYLCRKLELREINIENGIFGQPFVNGGAFDLSISHSEIVAASIAFDRSYPMGIDVEFVKSDKLNTLNDVIQKEEVPCCNINRNKLLTTVWTLKEALSKALRTGITVPLDILNVCNTRMIRAQSNCYMSCSFSNFPQYLGISKLLKEFVISIAYPRAITLNLE